MKNLVKKAKKKQLKSNFLIGISSIIFMVVMYFIVLSDMTITTTFDKNTYLIFIALILLVTLMLVFIVYLITYVYIWQNVINFQKFLKDAKATHIAILIESAINNVGCDKAEYLLSMYEKCPNHNTELFNYLEGVIDAIFYESIDLGIEELIYKG
jgi:hypothetical protein